MRQGTTDEPALLKQRLYAMAGAPLALGASATAGTLSVWKGRGQPAGCTIRGQGAARIAGRDEAALLQREHVVGRAAAVGVARVRHAPRQQVHQRHAAGFQEV